MNAAARDDTAHGLRIRSGIALPFTAASPAGEPDVDIRIGATPAALAALPGRTCRCRGRSARRGGGGNVDGAGPANAGS